LVGLLPPLLGGFIECTKESRFAIRVSASFSRSSDVGTEGPHHRQHRRCPRAGQISFEDGGGGAVSAALRSIDRF
jgi:hypothetical protein